MVVVNNNKATPAFIELAAAGNARIKSRAVPKPAIIPLRANSLTGITGRSAGVITAPDSMPTARARTAVAPRVQALATENTSGPMPDKTKIITAEIRAQP